MDDRQTQLLEETVFVPMLPNMLAIRKACKEGIYVGRKPRKYFVSGVLFFYRDCDVEEMLACESALVEELNKSEKAYQGKKKGCLCCVGIQSLESGQGVLIHKNSLGFICAWLPSEEKQTVINEYACAAFLLEASKAKIVLETDLAVSLPAGKRKISEWLSLLAERIKE